jgi:hypothetical protein
MGSVAFTATARACWSVTKDKADPARRLMLPVKCNLTADDTGLAFRITSDGNLPPVVVWEAEPVMVTVTPSRSLYQAS